jgi:uncharacterized protein GlcG (DUF336 family)
MYPVLGLDTALTIANACFNKGRSIDASPLTVAILDSGGCLITLQRQDGASIFRPDIAIAKALGSIGLGISSRAIGVAAQQRPSFISAISTLAQGNVVPVPGGVLIKNEQDHIIGAVGITGDQSDIDESCAIAGIEESGLKPGLD